MIMIGRRVTVVVALLTVFAAGSALAADSWLAVDAGGRVAVSPLTQEVVPVVAVERADATGLNVSVRFAGLAARQRQTKGGAFVELGWPDAAVAGQIGEPALPVVRKLFVAPPGATVSVDWTAGPVISEQLDAAGIGERVMPRQAPVPKIAGALEAAPFRFDARTYAVDGDMFADRVTIEELGIMRDQRLFLLEVRPLDYNPAANELKLWPQISVQIDFAGATPLAQVHTPPPGLAGIVLNPGLIPAGLRASGNYLIIVASAYQTTIAPFATAKQAQGFTVSTWVPTAASTTTIKSYIQGLWGTANAPDYILLVGDTDTIPEWTGGGEGSPDTDLPYSCMDGSTDWYPDIALGRFSVRSPAELQAIIDKTLYYENGPLADPNYLARAVFMASSDNYTVSEGTHNWVINNYMIPNDIVSDKLYCHTYNATTQQVRDAFNNGRFYGIYSGHGASTYWADGPVFYQSDVQGLTNLNMYPFVCSFACVTGDYANYNECFTETWIRQANKAAVAIYGSSVNSYWTEDDVLERRLFDSIYDDTDNVDPEVGPVWNDTRARYLAQMGAGSTTRRYFEMYNLLGDPSLKFPVGPEPPEAYNVSASTPYQTAATITLNATDDGEPNPPAAMDYVVMSLPSNGALTDPNAGSIGAVPYTLAAKGSQVVYAPAPDQYGADGFTYLANDGGSAPDGGDSNVANISVMVGGPAWDPVAHDMNVSTAVNSSVEIALDGSDPNADSLDYVIETLPAEGILVDPAAGPITTVPYDLGTANVVVYHPPCRQVLDTAFDFSVSDATMQSPPGTVDVAVTASDPRRVYYFPLDTNPGWSMTGLWGFGQPSGGGSHNYDPICGCTGDNVFGYNLFGDYSRSMPVYSLTTTALDCSQLTGTQLRFQRWLGVEQYDSATVELSTDGSSWTPLWQNPGNAPVADLAWTQMSFDISAQADGESTVYIRWNMGPTDNTVTYPGWNIDDVEIWGVVPIIASDFNGDGQVTLGDWDLLETCLFGPDGGMNMGCLCIDLDEDGDVDLLDFAQFQDEFVE